MHGWKDLTSCRGHLASWSGEQGESQEQVLGENYHHHLHISFFLSQGRTCADIWFLSIMMMASAQLRVFSSNNIEICIINPRIPVVEMGAVTPPHFPLPPLLCLFHSHPPSPPQFDVIKQERTERKGERFISYWDCPSPARKRDRTQLRDWFIQSLWLEILIYFHH